MRGLREVMDDPVLAAGCAARERAAIVVDAVEGALQKALFLLPGDERRAAAGKLRRAAALHLQMMAEKELEVEDRWLLVRGLEMVAEWLERKEALGEEQMDGIDGGAATEGDGEVQRCGESPVGFVG